VKNEADLDAGIIATQVNTDLFYSGTTVNGRHFSSQRRTLTFVQDKLSVLINYAVAALNKQSATGQGQNGAIPGQPGQPTPGLSMDYAMGLWRTYGSSVLSALQPAPAQTKSAPVPSPVPSPAASTTSFQASAAPNAERRLPQTPLDPAPQAPPFPVPQLS
jgi:receptor expression-enhancing protein 1/2/3/4